MNLSWDWVWWYWCWESELLGFYAEEVDKTDGMASEWCWSEGIWNVLPQHMNMCVVETYKLLCTTILY